MLIQRSSSGIKKLRRIAADPTIDLWAIDEVHFQQHGSRCRMWIPPEIKDPTIRHHPTRKSVGYFGAVRIRDGRFIFKREEGKFNAITCWDFFKQLRRAACRSGKKVYIISDNARYHHAKLHKVWRDSFEPDFTLGFLPPYSPDLNPIERVWKLVRRMCLHNCYFPKLELVTESVEAVFSKWVSNSDALRKLCAIT
jgi:transposase